MREFCDLVGDKPGPWYLGIDPSLTATGIAAINADGTVIPYTLSPPKGVMGVKRLSWFDTWFRMLLALPWSASVIEGYSFASKFSRAHDLGELGGIIRLCAHNADKALWSLPPKSLCMYLDGKGNVEKNVRSMKVLQRWGIVTANDNEADAVVLGQAAKSIARRSFTHAYQIDAVAKAEIICQSARVADAPMRVRKK